MEELNLLAIAAKGGWLTIPLVLCSMIMIAVVVERFLALRKASTNTGSLMLKIRAALSRSDIDGAIMSCREVGGPVGSVFESALGIHDQTKEEVKEAIENAGNAEVFQLERRVGILGTVAGVAPLIGFLGTVTGMIKAFMKIEDLGGNVNTQVLAGGIWEAMVTTAEGLTVGIPALIFYNYFISRIQRHAFEIETSSAELLNLLFREDEK